MLFIRFQSILPYNEYFLCCLYVFSQSSLITSTFCVVYTFSVNLVVQFHNQYRVIVWIETSGDPDQDP